MTDAVPTNREPGDVTATVSEGKTYDTGLADAFAEGNPWFPQLPTAKQAGVVNYAFANNSGLFERNEHGDNDQHAQERRSTPETTHA
jgi:hypothetical protein